MSDFQDDPTQGKTRTNHESRESEIAERPDSSLRETLGVKTSRMSILGEMHGKGDALISYSPINSESIESLNESLKKITITDLNEEARKILYEEIKEACSHLLSKMMNRHELNLESLSNLSEVLSDPELQALLDTLGSFSLGNLGADILKSLPEIDRFEGASYLERIITPEKSHKDILSEIFLQEYYPQDPISRFLYNLDADIKEALFEVDEFFVQYWNGKRKKTFSSSKEKALYLKEKAVKIKRKKQRVKKNITLLIGLAIFSLSLLIFRVFEVSNFKALIMSFFLALGGSLLKYRH